MCIADFVVKQQAVELQTAYNAHLGLQQTAQLRATKLAMATVAAESMVKAAEGDAASIKLRADAELYTETQRAEAIQVRACSCELHIVCIKDCWNAICQGYETLFSDLNLHAFSKNKVLLLCNSFHSILLMRL